MTLKRKNEIKLRLTDKELEQLNEDVKKYKYEYEELNKIILELRKIVSGI